MGEEMLSVNREPGHRYGQIMGSASLSQRLEGGVVPISRRQMLDQPFRGMERVSISKQSFRGGKIKRFKVKPKLILSTARYLRHRNSHLSHFFFQAHQYLLMDTPSKLNQALSVSFQCVFVGFGLLQPHCKVQIQLLRHRFYLCFFNRLF